MIRRRSAFLALCTWSALAAQSAAAVQLTRHDVEDLMAAGQPPVMIQHILEETGWDVVLSEADLMRLGEEGLPADVVAYLMTRVRESAPEQAVEETAGAVETLAYSSYYGAAGLYGTGFPCPYPSTAFAGHPGVPCPFLVGGAFHRHHFGTLQPADPSHHRVGHDEGMHIGSDGMIHSGHHDVGSMHDFAGVDGAGHFGGHAAHGIGHAGHGGHGSHH